MPRPPRADEAGGLYHALNRGNARATIFHKDADYEAFERILANGLARYAVQLFSYQLMPNHWHLVLRPEQDGEMSRFLRWITATPYGQKTQPSVKTCPRRDLCAAEKEDVGRGAVVKPSPVGRGA